MQQLEIASKADLGGGYIRIANEIVEKLMMIGLTQREWAIVMAVVRKTYGWNKKEDRISYSQFEELTGIKSNHLSVGLKALIKRKIVLKRDYLYSINTQCSEWEEPIKQSQSGTKKQSQTRTSPNSGLVPIRESVSPELGLKYSPDSVDTKDNKNTITKNSEDYPSGNQNSPDEKSINTSSWSTDTAPVKNKPSKETERTKSKYSPEFESFWNSICEIYKPTGSNPGSKREASNEFKKLKPSPGDIKTWLSNAEHQRDFKIAQAKQERDGRILSFKHVCRWIKYECYEERPEIQNVIHIGDNQDNRPALVDRTFETREQKKERQKREFEEHQRRFGLK